MDSRAFVSVGLLLFGLVTVVAQSNSANQGRGSLICVVQGNNGILNNSVQLLRLFILECMTKITLALTSVSNGPMWQSALVP